MTSPPVGGERRVLALLTVVAYAIGVPFDIQLAAARRAPAWSVPLEAVLEIAVVVLLGFVGLAAARALGLRLPAIAAAAAGEAAGPAVRRALAFGARLGAVLVVLALIAVPIEFAFGPRPERNPLEGVPLWGLLFAGLRAGVTEEIVFRLFLLSGVAWLIARLSGGRSGVVGLAAANLVAAVAFGAAHLPEATASSPEPLVQAIAVANRVVVGLVLGEAYRRRGIEAAMAAHAAYDVILSGLAVIASAAGA